MPELSEVETVRLQIDKHLRGKKIKDVVLDENDKYTFASTNPKEVIKVLKGAKITGTGRKGKYFWIELNRKPWPIIHLGMSGNISIRGPNDKAHKGIWGGAELWKKKDDKEALWFCRLFLTLEKGFELAFTDPRRFGRMWLSNNPLEHPSIKKLGPDPLIDFPSAKILHSQLSKRNRAIKAVLLDQKLFAGIGNWLADEILYQSRISPHRKASSLNSTEVKTLHKNTIGVVKKAVQVLADYEKFPKNWLFNHRWGKSKSARTSCNQKIIHDVIGGRTSAWVKGWQK